MIAFVALGLLSTSARAKEPSLFFARSGQTVHLPGITQLWLDNAPIASDSSGRFTLPSLRAPVCLQGRDNAGNKLAEFVVYPQTTIDPEETIAAELLKPPVWFAQWAEATQLLAKEEKPDPQKPRPLKTRLLIMGPDGAGESPEDVLKELKQRHLKTAWVFRPRWAGPTRSNPVSLAHTTSEEDLLKLPKDRPALDNSTPLNFTHAQTPYPGIVNRSAWVRIPGQLPYVEAIWMDEGHCILISYLPWQETLGRCLDADDFLRHLLSQAIETSEDIQGSQSSPETTIQLQWPRRWDIKKAERPIVDHLLQCQKKSSNKSGQQPTSLHLVDLRGKPVQRAKHDQLQKALKLRPLLILGTDPAVKEKTLKAPGVIWIKNDPLPSDAEHRYQIMDTLTALRVKL